MELPGIHNSDPRLTGGGGGGGKQTKYPDTADKVVTT